MARTSDPTSRLTTSIEPAVLVEASYGDEGADSSRPTIADFPTNTYDPATKTAVYSDARAAAHGVLMEHYHDFFANPAGDTGCGRPRSPTERRPDG
jgi:nitric oxide reductase subunit B